MHYYTLDENRQPHLCEEMDTYWEWHESMPESSDWYTQKTGVGFTVAREKVGEDDVSTVYLGLDHGWGLDGDAAPILWETMVFPESEICERYRTYEEAVAGHREIVAGLKAGHQLWAT